MYGYPGGLQPAQNQMPGQPQGQAQGPVQNQVSGQPAVHICFSGMLSCSGCNPCDACQKVVKENVLVTALIEEQRVLAMDLQAALQQGRPLNLQFLAETFFRTVANSWRQLHEAMNAEPPEQRPFRIANVSAILEAAESFRALMLEKERMAQAAAATATPPAAPPPQSHTATAPVARPPNMVPSAPVDFSKAMEMSREERPAVITVAAEEAAAPPAAPAPASSASPPAKRITAEDFARAAPSPDSRANGKK